MEQTIEDNTVTGLFLAKDSTGQAGDKVESCAAMLWRWVAHRVNLRGARILLFLDHAL